MSLFKMFCYESCHFTRTRDENKKKGKEILVETQCSERLIIDKIYYFITDVTLKNE